MDHVALSCRLGDRAEIGNAAWLSPIAGMRRYRPEYRERRAGGRSGEPNSLYGM